MRSESVRRTDGPATAVIRRRRRAGGDLFCVDVEDGNLHRIIYTAANWTLTPKREKRVHVGVERILALLDGTGSTHPEGKLLSDSWDVNGDGAFGDATGSRAFPGAHLGAKR